jgi:hypothetical protein
MNISIASYSFHGLLQQGKFDVFLERECASVQQPQNEEEFS